MIEPNEYLANHYFKKSQLRKVEKEVKRLNITTKSEIKVLRYLMYQDFNRRILLHYIEKIKEERGLVYYKFTTNKSSVNYCCGVESVLDNNFSSFMSI